MSWELLIRSGSDAFLNSVDVSTYVNATSLTGSLDWSNLDNVPSLMSGSGTENRIPKFGSSNALEDSVIYESSSFIGIGTETPEADLEVFRTHGGVHDFLKFGSEKIEFLFKDFAGAGGAPSIVSKGLDNAYSTFLIGDGVNDTGTNPMFRISGRINNGTVNTRPLFDIANVNTPKFTVLADGEVGINESSPSQRLHINGSLRIESGSIYDFNNSAGNNGQILSSTANGIEWTDTSLSASYVDWTNIDNVPSYDNYQYWNLKTNGTQRKQIQSTNDVDFVAGNNISVGYSAGGVVTINAITSSATGGDNFYLTGSSFNTGNGELSLFVSGAADVVQDLDGRYLLTTATASWAENSVTSSYIDWPNIDNIPVGLISSSAQVDHDTTTNFVTNEHINHSSVSITAGSGLTGGGDITTSRTINVGAGTGINVNTSDIELDILGLTSTNTLADDDEVAIYDISSAGIRSIMIQDMSLSLFDNDAGFVTSDTNFYLESGSFNTGNGILDLNVNGSTDVQVDLDGRYLQTTQTASWAENAITASYVHWDNIDNAPSSGANFYLTGSSFDTGNGVLSMFMTGSSDVTVDLDGRYLETNATASWALKAVSANSSISSSYVSAGNVDGFCEALEGCDFITGKTVTIQGDGDGTGGTGNFDIPGTGTQTIEITHVDTSTLNGTYGVCQGTNYITSVDVDSLGHVTGICTRNTSYGSSSDRRLKANIIPISSSLEKILQLNGVTFVWNNSDMNIVSQYTKHTEEGDEVQQTIREKHMGVIAQDVEEIFPEAVITDAHTGLKKVEYGKLVAPLIEAVKEQQNEIVDLKEENKNQQKLLNSLMKRIEKLENN